jgi:hypothetical protein
MKPDLSPRMAHPKWRNQLRVSRVLWIATLVAASPLAAQNAPASDWPVAEGSRVRIRSLMLGDDGPFHGARYATGSVVSATPDTLTFRADGDSTTTAILPIRRISKLEIAQGTHDNKKYGAWVGALSGFIAGATIAGLWHKPCGDMECPNGYYRERSGTAGGLLGAVAGAAVGAWLGRRPVETWVRVKMPAR